MKSNPTPTEPVHLKLPTEQKRWLEAEAQRRMVSVTYLVTQAVEQLRKSIPSAEVAA